MSHTRYDESRTLVRRLCRLPQEDPVSFKVKVATLRQHFEQFCQDAADLCQWLMGLRKRYGDTAHPEQFGALGDFILDPDSDDGALDDVSLDKLRRTVCDAALDIQQIPADTGTINPNLLDAIQTARHDLGLAQQQNASAQRLVTRLRTYDPSHRMILMKSAAEWVVTRFRRGVENWLRQHAEWANEKSVWEAANPTLTAAVRDRFTDVFKNLIDPSHTGQLAAGVRRKNPRICSYARMRGNLNNCVFAGQKGHAPLCWKYCEFVKSRKEKNKKFNDRYFVTDARIYIKHRIDGRTHSQALKIQYPLPKGTQAFQQFTDNWNAYLKSMSLTAETVIQAQGLPHCLTIGETFEKSQCTHNPHTSLCRSYKAALDLWDESTVALEPLYRAWRKSYLAGPRKPSFRYPSFRALPLPKVFGAGFHEVDFDNSIVRLRLEGMPPDQWLEAGFTAWPKDYSPTRAEIGALVTSVHVNFVGRRPRIGFRFGVPHKPSSFSCLQDEIDELRSRRFPRRAQDQQFLEASRELLLGSFAGGASAAKNELRVLAVDLGETGAHTALYKGTNFQSHAPLHVVKVNQLYLSTPETLIVDKKGRPARTKYEKDDPRGLRKAHVGLHLLKVAEGAKSLTEARRKTESETVPLGAHDFSGLKRHMAWMIRDWARLNAAQIVAHARTNNCHLIVFESLRGFLPPGYDQLSDPNKKRWLAMFAYGRIRRKVSEKAVEQGMRVITVPYHKSSQHCGACGKMINDAGKWRKNKKEKKFICEHCRHQCDSDENAARVLARVFWGEITLPVANPQ